MMRRDLMATSLSALAFPRQRRNAGSAFLRVAQRRGWTHEKTARDQMRLAYETVAIYNEELRAAGREDLVCDLMRVIDASMAARVELTDIAEVLHRLCLADQADDGPLEILRDALRHNVATVEQAREWLRKSAVARRRMEDAEVVIAEWIDAQREGK